MKKRLIAAVALAVVVLLIVVFYRSRNSRDRDAIVLSGNVEVTEVNVGFKSPGRVTALFTDEGKTVAGGDRIAQLDDAEYESLVSQNRAAVRNAEARLEQAKRDLERGEALFKKSVVSPQRMDDVRTAYDVARSQLSLSRAMLKTAEVRLSDTVLFAPISGVVLEKIVEAGETVGAGTPVFTIGDLEQPWVKVYVREKELGLVKLGQRAEIRTDSYPDKTYEGTVTYISSEAEFTPKNVQTQEERVKLVFGVKVKVKNEKNELKPGMPADVKILLKP
jgi:membrane fusion protein YbhG